MKIRTEKIDNKSIYVIDNVVSEDEIEVFYDYATQLPYKRSEKSTSYDQFPIFSTDFDPAAFEQETFIGQKARTLLDKFADDAAGYVLMRAYINLSNYGDVEFPHDDCPAEKDDMTVLYYVNKTWNYKFGGETMFYEGNDSRIAVLPAPGRFLIFPGNIRHMGTISTRICKESRFSLALKYARS
ncbi:hypothetical protein C7T94_05930 [Pedobacter yulinensis]|uniref:Prolyl 4-hydroxylase alpha subunit Fe(2+) 2OG dioxygenase domain-containing protein n=1 Tax=Pedobacter yulinensis TaxID=2126353 RepID=A0A2T3HP78_9SPHI|nr:2OG-Fe(II) oxygenase [Pedobacter yulinensis]PST84258.1 hypothetical protein C7T94_05930 [Pedobacter yulinensis]